MHELILLNNDNHSSNLTISKLRIRDDCFEYATGERITIKECTDFRLFERFLKGENIEHILQQRVALGFNMCRVLGTCHNMFRLYPGEWPFYFSRLDEFFRLTNKYIFIEFTVFADAPYAIPDILQQLGLWHGIGEVAQNYYNLLELVNENNVHWNTIDTGKFGPIPGVLCSHGSNGSQSDPVRPTWNYETFHTNDAFEWWRKGGHNAMEYYNGTITIEPGHRPVITNEKTRPDKDNNLKHHEDDARAAALLCAGSCFHSNSGKDSVLFSGLDLEAAKAFIKGADAINLEAQGKAYVHRQDLEEIVNNQPTKYLRVYQKGFEDRLDHQVFIDF